MMEFVNVLLKILIGIASFVAVAIFATAVYAVIDKIDEVSTSFLDKHNSFKKVVSTIGFILAGASILFIMYYVGDSMI